MRPTDTGLEFTKRELAALALFASADRSRDQLSAISFNPGKGIVFATDGHRILGWFGEKYYGSDMSIDLGGFNRALRVGDKKSVYRLVFGDNPTLEVDDTVFRLVVNRIVTPPIEQVFPKNRAAKHSPVTLQPRVLAGVLKACELLSPIRQCGFSFYAGESALDPVQLEFDQAKEWRALVMPMRGEAGV